MSAVDETACPALIPSTPSPTVLIVEDDEDLAALLDFRLRKEGFSTLIAEDGDKACRLLLEAETALDLVLLDILLPIMDGWEVCRFIRRHPAPGISSLPVIILSALTAGDNRVKGIKCGADIYLAKPYSVQEVILSCRKLIDTRRERTRLHSENRILRGQEENSATIRRMLLHELRSQFTVIGGLCQRLLNNDDIRLEQDKGKEYLRVIGHGVGQVSEMADQMLLLSCLDSNKGGLPQEACRLDEIITDVLIVHRHAAQKKGIDLQHAPLPSASFTCNRLALKIILSSLLENAIKYSPAQTAVNISAVTGDSNIRLVVQDQGPGIPLHEQQKIFAPYYRGEATRVSHNGTGLGLYSVKRLTEALGGAIRLSSAPGQGSIFIITFGGFPVSG